MKIIVINGPNLNMLGIREPEIYGSETYEDLVKYIEENRGRNCELEFFQSNHEGEIIDEIQRAHFLNYDGIVINPGGFTHTSIAIMDALKAISVPCVEVHITDPLQREGYRHHSFVSEAAACSIVGKGFKGYLEAIDVISEICGKN